MSAQIPSLKRLSLEQLQYCDLRPPFPPQGAPALRGAA
jgi:hypothetical protein